MAHDAKDSLGRNTGRQFNAAAIKREFLKKTAAKQKRAASFDERWEAARLKRLAQPLQTITF